MVWAYAPHWPTTGSAGVLIQASLGDRTVPVFTAAALGRAAQLVSNTRNELLIGHGVMQGVPANVDRWFGTESGWGSGFRFFGVNAHAGILVPDPPNPLALRARYAAAVQRQAFGFLETGTIDDNEPVFDEVVPR